MTTTADNTAGKPAGNTLYLIDSSIYIFRAWHILPASIVDPKGQPVNALYGFADFLAQLIEQVSPTYMVCAFDKSLTTSARNKIYPPYKANRDPAPEELKHQFSLCRQLAELCGIANFSHNLFEADDIIGTLAAMAGGQNHRSCIVSADKDLTQFVGDSDEYWNFAKKEKTDAAGIEKRFGVRPEQIADMLAISGDKVDNIPGIPGVGQATAARLLKKWQNLDRLFENRESVAQMKFRGAARVAQLLGTHEADVRLARKLTGLLPVPELPTDLSSLARKPVATESLNHFLEQNGFGESRRSRLVSSLC